MLFWWLIFSAIQTLCILQLHYIGLLRTILYQLFHSLISYKNMSSVTKQVMVFITTHSVWYEICV